MNTRSHIIWTGIWSILCDNTPKYEQCLHKLTLLRKQGSPKESYIWNHKKKILFHKQICITKTFITRVVQWLHIQKKPKQALSMHVNTVLTFLCHSLMNYPCETFSCLWILTLNGNGISCYDDGPVSEI